MDIHIKIKEKLNPSIHVAGPYWGLNLILWARGIITNPAFAIGSGYQYYRPGGQMNRAVPRMAIPPLRRWAKANSHLKIWLMNSARQVKHLPEGAVFEHLHNKYKALSLTKRHKNQIAKEYYNWFTEIETISKEGRALALFQDLSKAYVLGTQLDDIHSEDGVSRKPDIVAKQLMLNCL